MLTRRQALITALAAPATLRFGSGQARRILAEDSNEFPGGTTDTGDFRDRLTRIFSPKSPGAAAAN